MNDRDATPLDLHMRRLGVKTGAISALCGVTGTTVRYWRCGARRPSPQQARLIAAELDMPRHLLRPDLWDPPPPPAPAATNVTPPPEPVLARPRRRAPKQRVAATDPLDTGRLAFA